MEKFEVILPGSKLRAMCTRYTEHHPPSIMAMNMTAIEEDVTVYKAEVVQPEGGIIHHTLARDKNGHWQLNLLENVDHKTVEELKRAIDQHEAVQT
ncbi:MAG: hypothetical protein WKF97_26235 [Chitinophagaceae bacterium]